MKHLAAYNLVKETGKDQYVGTPFSMAANDPLLAAGITYTFEGCQPVFLSLPDFLAQTDYQVPSDASKGPVQFGHRTDKPMFGLLQERPKIGNAFNDFMTGYAKARPRWVDYYPCQERLGAGSGQDPLLVDVGGGLGHDLLAYHAKFPAATGQLVLEDQPDVLAQAQNAQPPLPAAIRPVPHDFFAPQPAACRGARAYFLRQILHDWPDARGRVILGHLRDAMTPGYSRIVINEHVVRDVGAPWQPTTIDWTKKGMLVSRERTESQWRELLASVGLKISGIWQKDPDDESVVEVVLADE